MELPREGGNGGDGGETRRDHAGGARDERASSCYYSSSSSSRQHGSEQPPPTQQMERRSSAAEEEGMVVVGSGDPGRIPAAVFERDTSESNKDWSMMSTDSVFALQVAPSSDFTGFFLAHPELMDIATPPRTSSAAAGGGGGEADGRVPSAQFESIPELGEATMRIQGQYSFAFPTYARAPNPIESSQILVQISVTFQLIHTLACSLVEVKRHSSKNPQEEHPMAATMATATPTAAAAPAPVKTETSRKPEEAPVKVAAKGGWLPCFPCC
uniref:Uncharacterized protein n=1 Tax=Oryza punctata TaxID=4537 RepID=A0A0E0L7W6_ORYPU